MNDLDLVNWYLDFKISYDILASKMIAPYIEKILKYFEMQQIKSINISMIKQHVLIYASKDYQANNLIKT